MFVRYNIIPGLWVLVVSLLILAPGRNLPETGSLVGLDKIAHTLVFSVEAILVIVGFSKQKEIAIFNKKPVFWGIIIGLIHNIILEFGQLLIPDRTFDPIDMLANCAGLFVGMTIFWIIYKF